MIMNKENYLPVSQNSYENTASSTNSNYFYINQKTYYDNSNYMNNTRQFKAYPKNENSYKYYLLFNLPIVHMMIYTFKI